MTDNLTIIYVSHKRIEEKGGIESMIKLLISKNSPSVRSWLVSRHLIKMVSVANCETLATSKEINKNDNSYNGPKNIVVSEYIYLLVNIIFSVFAAFSILSLIKHERKMGYSVVLHAMDTVYGGLAASIASLFSDTPFVTHTHGVRAYYMSIISKKRLVKTIDFLIELIVTHNCSTLICVNQQATSFWARNVVKDKIRFIPVPVDTKLFAPSKNYREQMRLELQIDTNTLVFGYVGRLSPEKISVSLLESFRLANVNSKLVIIGDGPLMTELKDYTASKGLSEQIIFTGFRSDVFKLINLLDVFILPSLIEGMPTVILEAFSNGKVVVASNIPANREIINHNINGVLFEPAKVECLTSLMVWLNENPSIRAELAKNSLISASKYDVYAVSRALYCLYNEILGH